MQNNHARLWAIVTSLVLGVACLFLFLGGAQLLFLGGSWFYIVAGAIMLAAAGVGFRKPALATQLYARALVLAPLLSLAVVRLNIWGLDVRLLTLAVFGF